MSRCMSSKVEDTATAAPNWIGALTSYLTNTSNTIPIVTDRFSDSFDFRTQSLNHIVRFTTKDAVDEFVGEMDG